MQFTATKPELSAKVLWRELVVHETDRVVHHVFEQLFALWEERVGWYVGQGYEI